ncbi:MAG: cytochrome c [Rhodospirillales bacterium]|nr:cytochrome c [Rhodospirillales bacterium]
MGREAALLSFMMLIAVVIHDGETASAQVAPSERGHALAQKLCARCHAIEREGASPMGLAPPFRELSQRYPIEMLAEALAEGIVTGHPAMPTFTFEPRDINALLTYIDGLTSPSGKRGQNR